MTFVCIGTLTCDLSHFEEREKKTPRHCRTTTSAESEYYSTRGGCTHKRLLVHQFRSKNGPQRRGTLGGLSNGVRHRGNSSVLRRTKEMFTPHAHIKSSDAFRVRRPNHIQRHHKALKERLKKLLAMLELWIVDKKIFQ